VGDRVGLVWLALRRKPDGSLASAWIYDIEVDAAHRGAGYGRALLTDQVALRLYTSSGYRVTSQQMLKELG
jgi:GNAT superfamily N-acetyltransferase